MIPQKIFQTCKEKNIENKILKSWQDSWKNENPNFEYTLWTDEENRQFIEKEFPQFLTVYDNYDVNIKRVDAIRYFYLLKHGGIYADLDFICLKPFDQILKVDADVIFGFLGKMDNSINIYHKIPNALMIAKPNTDFFYFLTLVLENVAKLKGTISPELQTGPIFLSICVQYYTSKTINKSVYDILDGNDIFSFKENVNIKYDSKILIAEPEIFYPINWDNKEHDKYRAKFYPVEELKEFFPQAFATTIWMHSW